MSIIRAIAPPLRTYSFDSRMPRLPPVEKSPHTSLRATFCPGVGNSVVTFDQSALSSSATSWARPVSVPWPISERAMRMTMVSSGLITTQASTSGEPSWARTTLFAPSGRLKPSARPAPAADEPTMKERRLNFGMCVMAASPLRFARGRVDRGANALIGSATADVGHRRVDIVVGRFWVLLEQRCCRHHHAALAIAALRHVEVEPGLLHRVQLAVLRQRLDGGDLLGADRSDWDLARARGDAVDVHGAGAALGDAAAVFGAGQSDRIADDPEQWRVGFNVDAIRLSVDGKGNHTVLPVAWYASPYGTEIWRPPLAASLPCSNSNANRKIASRELATPGILQYPWCLCRPIGQPELRQRSLGRPA